MPVLCVFSLAVAVTAVALPTKRNRSRLLAERYLMCPKLNCSRSFALYTSLTRHLRKHESYDKSHVCSDCGKAFARLKYLKLHSRMHSGQMPFFCAECDKHFRSRQTLREHKTWKHQTEEKFPCSECGKRFKTRARMQSHVLAH